MTAAYLLLLLLILIQCEAVASPLGEHDDDALLLVAFGRSTTYDDAISSWILIHTFSIVVVAHAAHNRGVCVYVCVRARTCVAHHFSLFCELQPKRSSYIYAHLLYPYEHFEKTETTETRPRFRD